MSKTVLALAMLGLFVTTAVFILRNKTPLDPP
jgi:hypothetical protein